MTQFVVKMQICKSYGAGQIDVPINNDYVAVPVEGILGVNSDSWDAEVVNAAFSLVRRNWKVIGLPGVPPTNATRGVPSPF